MACPICTTPESAAIAAGIRAGALVLIVVTTVVIALFARFAWRLWKLERWGQTFRFAQGKSE